MQLNYSLENCFISLVWARTIFITAHDDDDDETTTRSRPECQSWLTEKRQGYVLLLCGGVRIWIQPRLYVRCTTLMMSICQRALDAKYCCARFLLFCYGRYCCLSVCLPVCCCSEQSDFWTRRASDVMCLRYDTTTTIVWWCWWRRRRVGGVASRSDGKAMSAHAIEMAASIAEEDKAWYKKKRKREFYIIHLILFCFGRIISGGKWKLFIY